MKQMILKIDDDADINLMPEDLRKAISKTKIQWPQGQLIGTKSYYNKRLILILSPIEPEEIESLFDDFDLAWSILAVEGEIVDQKPILKFMEDVDGEDVTDITGKLQIFAGHLWTYD